MLKDLLERLTEQEEPVQEHLPKAWGILYANPNPDDSRKQCLNCIMWSRDNRCSIHESDEETTEDHTCGYHVYGNPMEERMVHEGMDAVTPDLSGLELIPGGTSCDICEYYVEDSSTCRVAVGDDGKHLQVAPKGCCARWDAKE